MRVRQVLMSATAVAVLTTGGVTAGPTGPALAAKAASTAAPGQGALTLITGQQFEPASEGPGHATLLTPAASGKSALEVIGAGANTMVFPAEALPFLGHGLAPSLFNVADLRQAEHDGRLPVRVSYSGSLQALPGIQITSSRPGSAAGYLTSTSAAKFGAALARLDRADHARASYGTDGLFAGGLTITLATAAGREPRQDRPAFPMETLTVKATDRFGKPDTGDSVEVDNVDNNSYFTESADFYKGVAKLSVPVGHYWAISQFTDFFDSKDPADDWRLVVIPQFTVGRHASTISLSEKSAVSEIEVRTPRPAVAENTQINFLRTGHAGPVDIQEFNASGISLWVNKTTVKPGIGSLLVMTQDQLVKPHRVVGTTYEYDLAFSDPAGMVPSQHYAIRPSMLATVDARYFQDRSSIGAQVRSPVFPGLAGQFTVSLVNPFSMPRRQIEYVNGSKSIEWFELTGQTYWPPDPVGGQDEALRLFHGGEHLDENWNAYPLSPEPDANLAGPANFYAVQPSAVRRGDELNLAIAPFGDSQPGHTGPGFSAGSYSITDNGRKIAAGRLKANFGPLGGSGGFTNTSKLTGRPSVVSVALNVSRPAGSYPLSGHLSATWTWRTARQPRRSLPKGWTCHINYLFEIPDGGRHCTVQPLMMLRYVVAGLGLNGRTPAGRQSIGIQVNHLPLASEPAVTGLAVRYSLNDGKTWHQAAVTRTAPRYFVATFTAPPGSYVTLRARAADAAGGSVRETVGRAYQTGHARPRAAAALRPACPTAKPRQLRCYALYSPQAGVNAALAAGRAARPAGWGAQSIESAYKLPVSRDVTQTVAVVDAFSTPKIAQDLAAYRQQYGLPACTTASGCFQVVNQKGEAGPLPTSGVPFGWDVETALDVEMVSAACPSCHILLVEADSPAVSDLAASENTAARLGAQVISNSYGITEGGFVQGYASSYVHPGHMIVVAGGDFGFGPASFPANLASVVSVGGTQLSKAAGARGWKEQVWNSDDFGAGASGCSAYVPKPRWQHDAHCPMRTLNDVSAIAAGVAMYDQSRKGWLTVAGTSVAAPVIAGVFGLAANGAKVSPAYLYRHAGSLFDVTKGSNALTFEGANVGPVCGGDYLCQAKPGYDAPTGLGTPDGIGAF